MLERIWVIVLISLVGAFATTVSCHRRVSTSLGEMYATELKNAGGDEAGATVEFRAQEVFVQVPDDQEPPEAVTEALDRLPLTRVHLER